MFAGANPYTGITNEELNAAQQNQQFWNNVSANFNPQSTVMSSPTSAPAYNNIAAQAQNILKTASAGGPTGSADLGNASDALGKTGGLVSRTEDLNNFLGNMNANQKSAESREVGMFGNANDVNAKNNVLNFDLPQEAARGMGKTTNDIKTMWNQYLSQQPNVGDQIAGSVGGLFGQIAGSKLGQGLFGSNNQNQSYLPSLQKIESSEEDLPQ